MKKNTQQDTTAAERQVIEDVVQQYEGDDGMLVPMMQDIQTEYGYLPVAPLRDLAEKLDIPLSRVYSVATFYSSFRLAPKGQHEVTLCVGTVCYLKGAREISEMITKDFNVEAGGTTADGLFSYQPVNCVGACALAPVMIIDGEYHDGVTTEAARDLLQGLTSADESKTTEAEA